MKRLSKNNGKQPENGTSRLCLTGTFQVILDVSCVLILLKCIFLQVCLIKVDHATDDKQSMHV